MSTKAFVREADGILVRPFALRDAPAFFAAVRASIHELSYWMPWCSPAYSVEDAHAWMRYCESAWQSGSEFPLGVFDAASGDVLGGTGLNHINKTYRIGNLGYWISTPSTGCGVARRAAGMAAGIAFDMLGLTRLEIVVLTHNFASQRVAAALGATRECVARNRLYFAGKPHDAIVYSLVPGDASGVAISLP